MEVHDLHNANIRVSQTPEKFLAHSWAPWKNVFMRNSLLRISKKSTLYTPQKKFLVKKVDFLVFLGILTSKSVKNGRNDLLFFFKMAHFLRRIRWWYSFFEKIKLNAIFWGLKLKNHGHGPSTTNFVLTLNRVSVSEKNSFFF